MQSAAACDEDARRLPGARKSNWRRLPQKQEYSCRRFQSSGVNRGWRWEGPFAANLRPAVKSEYSARSGRPSRQHATPCRRVPAPLSHLRPAARSSRKVSRVPVQWSWAAGGSFPSSGKRDYTRKSFYALLKSVMQMRFRAYPGNRTALRSARARQTAELHARIRTRELQPRINQRKFWVRRSYVKDAGLAGSDHSIAVRTPRSHSEWWTRQRGFAGSSRC